MQREEIVDLLADPRSGLVVSPILDPAGQVGTASIDLRLGPDIIISRRATGATAFDPSNPAALRRAIGQRQTYVRRRLGDAFHLQPGEFVIARTLEFVRLPSDVSGQALGRSSWGRLGLTIATATMVEPGFKGTITLELGNVANTPIVLRVGLSIAQLVLDRARPSGTEPEPAVPSEVARHQDRARRWMRANVRAAPSGRDSGQLAPASSKLHLDRDVRWVVPITLRYAVGIVGERFAGKSTVVSHLIARRGYRLYRFSDVLRDEADREGLDPDDRGVLRGLGDRLRTSGGEDVLARMLFERIRTDHIDHGDARRPARIVVEGFKVAAELELFSRLSFFTPVIVGGAEGAGPTGRWRLNRAVSNGWLPDEQWPPMPPTNDPACAAWFEAHVDHPEHRHDLGCLISVAEGTEGFLRIDNSAHGVPTLIRRTDALRRELDRRWRDREL